MGLDKRTRLVIQQGSPCRRTWVGHHSSLSLSPPICTMGSTVPSTWLSSVGRKGLLCPLLPSSLPVPGMSGREERWAKRRKTGFPRNGIGMDACWVLVKGCSFIAYGWALVVLTGAQGTCASPGWVGGSTRPSALCVLPYRCAVGRGPWAFLG